MSTRANIIIKDDQDELIFYRHSDGYPEGAMPTLLQFMSLVKAGNIRDNVGQAAGWLVILGSKEGGYQGDPAQGMSWKVGAIEPTTNLHGDIEYLYVVDLVKKTVKHTAVGFDANYNAVVPRKFYNGKFQREGAK